MGGISTVQSPSYWIRHVTCCMQLPYLIEASSCYHLLLLFFSCHTLFKAFITRHRTHLDFFSSSCTILHPSSSHLPFTDILRKAYGSEDDCTRIKCIQQLSWLKKPDIIKTLLYLCRGVQGNRLLHNSTWFTGYVPAVVELIEKVCFRN